jgi:hypothetical protein
MEVSVLEAKRLGQRGVLVLLWVLLVASVACPPCSSRRRPTLASGLPHRRGDPVWRLGSFAVLSPLYRAQLPTSGADPAPANAKISANPKALGAGQALSNDDRQRPGIALLTKRAHAARIYADLSADGALVSAGQLAAAAGLSASYARPGRRVPRPAAGGRPPQRAPGQPAVVDSGGRPRSGTWTAGPAES